MVTLAEKLETLLVQKFEEDEFNHLFLVDLKVLPGANVQVFLDSDEAVLFSHCARISRYLEQEIEENKWLGEKYVLDVSSAGVGAPLVLKRQYKKNIGRTLSVQVEDDHKHIKGTLVAVEDETIEISYEEKVRVEGKKKKELVTINKTIPFEKIVKAVVKVSF